MILCKNPMTSMEFLQMLFISTHHNLGIEKRLIRLKITIGITREGIFNLGTFLLLNNEIVSGFHEKEIRMLKLGPLRVSSI